MYRVFLILCVFFLSSCSLTLASDTSVSDSTAIMKTITPKNAHTKIENNTDITILDVRTPQEFLDGHLKNAINIDFYANDFATKLKELSKNTPYIVYCRTDNRSEDVQDLMQKVGFSQVYKMEGGIVRWDQENLPIIH